MLIIGLSITFDISMAFIRYDCRLWICARARFYHAFLRRCFHNTVLIKQSAYINRGLFLGRYVIDTVRVFLPKRPLTTVRSGFCVHELQIVRLQKERTVFRHILWCITDQTLVNILHGLLNCETGILDWHVITI